MDYITEIFCAIDDFCKDFESALNTVLISDRQPRRRRAKALCLSEIMTIAVLFHQSGFRFFKYYYSHMIQLLWTNRLTSRDQYPSTVCSSGDWKRIWSWRGQEYRCTVSVSCDLGCNTRLY